MQSGWNFKYEETPMLWILNAPVLCNTNINVYINFVDSVLKAYVLDLFKNPELFKLVFTYQVHPH